MDVISADRVAGLLSSVKFGKCRPSQLPVISDNVRPTSVGP